MKVAQLGFTLVCIVIVTLVWKVVNWVWWRPKKLEMYLKQQGVRGTSYKFLFGDAKFNSQTHHECEKSMGFSHDYIPQVFPFLHQMINKYGKISLTWMGPLPVINITDVELMREVLTKVYEFQKPKTSNPFVQLLLPSLFTYEGIQWARHRKLINAVFNLSQLKLIIVPAVYTSCAEMLNEWEKAISQEGSSCELDVKPYIEILSAEAISRATFGAATCEEGNRVFKLLDEQTPMVARMIESIYIPGSRFLPTRTNRRIKEINEETQKLLRHIISARKAEMLETSGADAPSTKHDFLSILMESISDEHQLIDDCKLFYFAGKDSTSKFLVWIMILLSMHQDWQASARQEVLSTFGPTGQPHFDGLNQLKIVTQILYEVLRLYPLATKLFRCVSKETKVGNLSLPAGTLILLPVVAVHHDTEIWGDDAKEFNPERFSHDIFQQAAKPGKSSVLAFSTGPRSCIGQNYALIQAKLVLAMILQRFNFELSPSYVHAPYVNLSLQPKFGAPIILRRL